MTERLTRKFKRFACIGVIVCMLFSMICIQAIADEGKKTYSAGDTVTYKDDSHTLPELGDGLYWHGPIADVILICDKDHEHNAADCYEITGFTWTVYKRPTVSGYFYNHIIVNFTKDGVAVPATEVSNVSVKVNLANGDSRDMAGDGTTDDQGFRFVGARDGMFVSDGYDTERQRVASVVIKYTYDELQSTCTIDKFEDLIAAYNRCPNSGMSSNGLDFIVEAEQSKYYYQVNTEYYTGDSVRPDRTTSAEVISTTASALTYDAAAKSGAYVLDEQTSNYKNVDLSASKNDKDKAVEIKLVYRRALYNVSYEFVSATEGENLPVEVTSLLPGSKEMPNGETASAQTEYDPVEVKDSNGVVSGTWTFKGWDSAEKTISDAAVTFTGKWEYTAASDDGKKDDAKDDADKTDNTKDNTDKTDNAKSDVKTADTANTIPFAAAMLLAGAGIAIAAAKRRSSKS